jgi:cell division protein FtsA
VEYITGMDTRIGYPNEHLAGDSDAEIASPTYATAVGLLMNAVEHKRKYGKKTQKPEAGSPAPELVLEGVERDPQGSQGSKNGTQIGLRQMGRQTQGISG